jgi:aminoglycoside phosphotransferase (APT) family kinase protein
VNEELRKSLEARLPALLGGPVEIAKLSLLAGGASMEAWALEVRAPSGPLSLVLRRAAGGRIYHDALSLEHEHALIAEAHRSGVKVPRPYGFLPDLSGHDAFLMDRLYGETVGRRVVRLPELAGARAALPAQMAEELARIHALDPARLPFLPGTFAASPALRAVEGLVAQLDSASEPHPAIELGIAWLRENLRDTGPAVVVHGDFRIGNLVVGPEGLSGVLDWEFARLGDALEDVAWPLVKAWRFGVDHLRLGGISEERAMIDRYAQITGRKIDRKDLHAYELLGNVRWAVGSLQQTQRHLRGEEKSVELAILGRLACEVEHEILQLLEEPASPATGGARSAQHGEEP